MKYKRYPLYLIYNNPFNQKFNGGWYNYKRVYYLNLGPVILSEEKNLVKDIYQFIYGFDDEGNPIRVKGQDNVIDVVPIDEDYTPLWKVVYVIVPKNFIPQSIRSVKQIMESDYKIKKTDIIINCPVL
ncbi:hypothetical protein BBF96_12450 [Anoxybacter fermentans]|uniref:DUF7482 domain-containing protein n=1 Tax=Anoxybacter fermentans TaxID=1323375 RepID=A0A3Q9HRI9_9FIRM|nr:hypothetical protein [Anoxybacter fermentans]AZR74137.1 hypothetical protein BBF96_12450 [Anoxybacter fermentans]